MATVVPNDRLYPVQPSQMVEGDVYGIEPQFFWTDLEARPYIRTDVQLFPVRGGLVIVSRFDDDYHVDLGKMPGSYRWPRRESWDGPAERVETVVGTG